MDLIQFFTNFLKKKKDNILMTPTRENKIIFFPNSQKKKEKIT